MATAAPAADADDADLVVLNKFERRGAEDALRDVRKQLATQRGKPHYVIASNRTLEDMARTRPTTKRAMLAVHGMGETRWKLYGESFMAAIRLYNEDLA